MWGHLLQGRYKALLVDGESGDYFPTVGSYIHLNPARAKLFNLLKGKLTDHQWSSYPLYLRPSKRPGWLSVDRILGAMGVNDTPSGRTVFRSTMQKRVVEIVHANNPMEADASWKQIRRGWCLGSSAFRNELLDKLDGVIGNKGKRESFDGEQMRLHDEFSADKLLHTGLSVLGLEEAGVKGHA